MNEYRYPSLGGFRLASSLAVALDHLTGTLRTAFARFSAHAQRKRAAILRSRISLHPSSKIIDLGGNDGGQIARLFPEWKNVTICDLSEAALVKARARGFDTIQADATGGVPVPDNHFDFCFCSSVIEHVTGPKAEMRSMTDGHAFKQEAIANQLAFAAEIRRIAKSYFVQTPHPLFPIESHTWLPGVILLLPRARLLALVRFTNRFWPKKAAPDWHLLTAKDMARMFPDAEIVIERFCGLPKSIIAMKEPAPPDGSFVSKSPAETVA
jgi:SAM-dependent methyltransferase